MEWKLEPSHLNRPSEDVTAEPASCPGEMIRSRYIHVEDWLSLSKLIVSHDLYIQREIESSHAVHYA